MKAFKLGLKLGQVSTQNVGSHFALNASSELVQGQASCHVKSKFFLRKSVPFSDNNFNLQTTLAGGYIHNLAQNALRVNDAFYLQNFKGIRNLGYHFDDSENDKNKKGLAGDILGFNKYLTLGLKLSHSTCPLLSLWDISPFVFANAALAPNRNTSEGQESASSLASYLRLSAGFGLSMDVG